MLITAISATNLLSFRALRLALDPRLTVVVGPNGAGKSNLLQLLELAGLALAWADDQAGAARVHDSLEEFARAKYNRAPEGDEIELRLDLALDQQAERDLLVGFVQAAVASGMRDGSQEWDEDRAQAWAATNVDAQSLENLLHGSLVLRHPGYRGGEWLITYEFEADQVGYSWHVGPFAAAREGIVRSGGAPSRRAYLVTKIGRTARSEEGVRPQAFTLGNLLPEEGEQIELAVNGPQQWPGPLLFRRFAALAGIEPQSPAGRSYSVARVLRRSLEDALRLVSVPAALDPRRFNPSLGPYTLVEIAGTGPSSDTTALPLRLFHLKNGTTSQRARFHGIQQLFAKLAPRRQVDIAFESIVSAQRPVYPSAAPVEPPLAHAAITAQVTNEDDGLELPIHLTGAGTQEALVLAEAIVDSKGRVIFLDEPALNLHPTWQASIRSQLQAAPGQFVVITHSPELVPTENPNVLKHIVRFSRSPEEPTVAHRIDDLGDPATAAKMVKEFAASEVRGLLFAAAVCLVEGDTECAALPIWFGKSGQAEARGRPERHQMAFLAVHGDRNFQIYLTVLGKFGIPWAVICDGNALDVTGQSNILAQIQRSGAATLPGAAVAEMTEPGPMDVTRFERVAALAAELGVFTLAEGGRADGTTGTLGAHESFEGFVEQKYPGALAEAEAHVGDSKPRRGRWIAEHFACPVDVDRLYALILNRIAPSVGLLA